MGEIVLKSAYVLMGTTTAPVNLTDHVRSVTINYSAELQDKTAMKSNSRSRIAGLKDWSVDIEFNQDYASSKVDQTLFGYVGSTNKWISIRPTTAKSTDTNPRYHGKCLLEGYSPISGGVGDLETVSVTFMGDGNLTRSTTS